MLIIYAKLDGIYGFNDFEINLSYPKKIVNSFLPDEHLKDRPSFRYKKVIILMGTNAAGKTCLGKALHGILDYLQDGLTGDIYKIASRDTAYFTIDFVPDGSTLYRFEGAIYRKERTISVHEYKAKIGKSDSYEMCVSKLSETEEYDSASRAFMMPFQGLKGNLNYRFIYPEIEQSLKTESIDPQKLLKTLRAVIGTLDPTLTDISISGELKKSYIIRRENEEIIIQDGKLLNPELLSTGTADGIGVAVFLAAMLERKPCFYYCDEHFSYIHSELEKRIFGIMLEYIPENGQLIFTTHNMDMLDLNLPKHAYVFLRKQNIDGKFIVSAVSASDSLKRNTDSVRAAVENDVFNTLPDDHLLDELQSGSLGL